MVTFALINGVSSALKNVNCGVPQGSTLSPLLFILYMNELPQVTKIKLNFFVDDTNLILSGNDPKLLQSNLINSNRVITITGCIKIKYQSILLKLNT